METFHFQKLTLREFSFLLENGFRLIEANATLVRFEKDRYYINVYYGRRSREIGIEVGHNGTNSPNSFSFNVLVSAFDKARGFGMPLSMPILTASGVEERIRGLADDFRRYVDLEAFDSDSLLGVLNSRAKELMETRYPTISVEELRKRFLSLWLEGEYAELINLFEPLRAHLTLDESQKLDIAKKRLVDSTN